MTPAGWYGDPEREGMLRWWDGELWTEDRRPAVDTPASDGGVLVRVGVGKNDGTELVATADSITIRGKTFALTEIDAVQYTAVRSHLNGAYMGTQFSLQVRAGDRKQSFLMATNHKNQRLDEFSDAFGLLVALLDATVCSRLAADMATLLAAGETITLGPAGARVELTREGFRLKKPLSKAVPWTQVTGTDVEGGRVFFLVRKQPGREPRRHAMVGLDGDNMVVLPHLVRRLAAAAG